MSDDFYGIKGKKSTGDVESLSKPLDTPITHIAIDEENITKGVPDIDPKHLEKTGGTISLEKMGELYEAALPEATRQENMTAEEMNAEFIPPYTPKNGDVVELNGVNIEVKDSAPDGEILSINTDDFKLTYSHNQLLQALYWIFDAFERSNMTFFTIYSTAESVLEQKDLEGDKITVGIRDMIWESGARQIFDTYVQYKDKEDNKFTYIADNGVPVEVTVFKDDECIMSPDTKMYHSEAFRLPNPYSRFLEVYK